MSVAAQLGRRRRRSARSDLEEVAKKKQEARIRALKQRLSLVAIVAKVNQQG